MSAAPLPIGAGDEYVLVRSEPRLYGNDPESKQIVEWRRDAFKSYGFTSSQAHRLARRRDIDRERVKTLLGRGCAHALVVRIVL